MKFISFFFFFAIILKTFKLGILFNNKGKIQKIKNLLPVLKLKKLTLGAGNRFSKKIKAFTLLGIIIVIIILAILATIAFISFGKYNI